MQLDHYPYFVYPLIAELKTYADPARAEKLRLLISANVGDPDALRALIGQAGIDFRSFYPDNGDENPSLDATIDSFIAKFGGDSSLTIDSPLFPGEDLVTTTADELKATPEKPTETTREEPTKASTEEPTESVPEVLMEAATEELTEAATDELTEAATDESQKADAEKPREEAGEEPREEERRKGSNPEESDMSDRSDMSDMSDPSNTSVRSDKATEADTLPLPPGFTIENAMQHVKKREYPQALAIMEAIYLNNPKKSVYFADQIRFIKKMMLNERKK